MITAETTENVRMITATLQDAVTLNPGQSVTIPASDNGSIFVKNDGQKAGEYTIMFGDHSSAIGIPASASKVSSYQSAIDGKLTNTKQTILEVSISAHKK